MEIKLIMYNSKKAQIELIEKISAIREQKSFSQRKLAEISGIKQPAIARLESQNAVPRIDTLLKLLAPLGYTLSIVPIETE